MWALRRASAISSRVQGLNATAVRASDGLGTFGSHAEDEFNSERRGSTVERLNTLNNCRCSINFLNRFFVSSRSFCSHIGAKSGGEKEDDFEEGIPKPETLEASESTGDGDEASDTSSDSESDLSNAEDIMEESLETELMDDAEVDDGETVPHKSTGRSPLLTMIMNDSSQSMSDLLDSYFSEGKDVNRGEMYQVMQNLRRRKKYSRALQLSEWLEKRKGFDFTERDYASRVDLIAKVRGLQKAEQFIDSIPKSHRQEVVYRTFLANCVSHTKTAKAEQIFNRMKDLGFPISAFTCNQLLILYKRTDKKKIADVLLMMEKEDIKPTLFTYQLLIDAKGRSNDIVGMEKTIKSMEAEGFKPNTRVQATLAHYYALNGCKEKAEAVLKMIEGDDLKSKRWICHILLPIYAHLGMVDDVERVWRVCEPKPREAEFLGAIEAWGKLKNIEQAEAVYTMMTKSIKNLNTRHYSVMLEVYAQNKMLSKGKQLLKQMGDSGCYVGPVAWDSLVRLYVEAGEVEKADSVLYKATQQNQQTKPFFASYFCILDQYAKRGDVHNAEKIFHRMRQVGYVSRGSAFSALLQAYINAKAPAYGFRERMKADNIFPNSSLASKLAQADAFKKNPVSDLLD